MKYAFVTGASRGIGREVSKLFAQKGYFVFLAGRDIQSLEATKNSIGENSQIVKLDLLSLESIKAISSEITKITDHIDILANIAGMYHDEKNHFFDIPFEQYPDDAIIKNINGILIGHILLTKYLVSFMSQGSSIVNMSGSFDDGETGVISDFITKKGMELFTKQLPLELNGKSIRVNAVRPGFVYTESVKKFFPNVSESDTLSPAYVAQKVVDLAEDNNLNGTILDVKK